VVWTGCTICGRGWVPVVSKGSGFGENMPSNDVFQHYFRQSATLAPHGVGMVIQEDLISYNICTCRYTLVCMVATIHPLYIKVYKGVDSEYRLL